MLYVVELVLGASWKELLPIYFVTLGNYENMRGFAKLEHALDILYFVLLLFVCVVTILFFALILIYWETSIVCKFVWSITL